MRAYVALMLAPLLSGCIVDTALDVASLPVKAASAGVDAATTSQAEADRNRGRALREQEERDAKARKRAEKQARENEPRRED